MLLVVFFLQVGAEQVRQQWIVWIHLEENRLPGDNWQECHYHLALSPGKNLG